MAIKEIIQHPDKKLREKSGEVKDMEEAKKIAEDLIDTLENYDQPGAGLAAPQIGINKRVFLARRFWKEDGKEKYENMIFINPKIKKLSDKKVKSLEGCLSIKDTYGYVERGKRIRLSYQDLNGKENTINARGFLAQVLQHEYDHLEGVLFIDKLIDNKSYSEKEIDEKLKKEG